MPINYNEIGYSGLKSNWGQVQEEFITDLRYPAAYKKYDEMRLNSPVVGSLLLAIEHSVRSVKFQFQSDLGEEDQRLPFLNAALNSMSHSVNDLITEALTMLPFGFSLFEICYRRAEPGDPPDLQNRITWRKFAPRSQDTVYQWQRDDTGGLSGIIQWGAPKYQRVEIPIEKLILFRTRVEKNNPEGRSILRTAWIPYYYQKNIAQVEAIGIERDLAGLPVIKLPQGADTSETESSDGGKAAQLVRRIRQDEEAGVVLPYGWELTLLSTGGSRQFDTDKVINRYESRILMASLAQFLMLGQEGVGSLALSSDQTDLFVMSVNTVADTIAETFSKYAVPRLLALNGMETGGVKLTHSPAGDVNLQALSDFLQKIGSLLTWTPADEVWLRQTAKLPEVDPAEIEMERERKSEIAMAIAQRAPAQQEDEQDAEQDDAEEEDTDEGDGAQMRADLFASQPPNNTQRLYFERRYRSALRGLFGGMQKRIVKGVKNSPGVQMFDIEPGNDEQRKAVFAKLAESGGSSGGGGNAGRQKRVIDGMRKLPLSGFVSDGADRAPSSYDINRHGVMAHYDRESTGEKGLAGIVGRGTNGEFFGTKGSSVFKVKNVRPAVDKAKDGKGLVGYQNILDILGEK